MICRANTLHCIEVLPTWGLVRQVSACTTCTVAHAVPGGGKRDHITVNTQSKNLERLTEYRSRVCACARLQSTQWVP